MEKAINEKESLRIISEMIATAKNTLSDQGGWTSLFWGYSVAIVSFLNFALLKTISNPQYSFIAWTAMIPAAIIYYLVKANCKRRIGAKSHIESIIGRVWLCFMICVVLMQVLFWLIKLPGNIQFVYFTPLILILLGTAQHITGFTCRYKLYIYPSFIFWAGAVACGFINAYEYQFVVLGCSMIAGMVIPGHILRAKMAKNV